MKYHYDDDKDDGDDVLLSEDEMLDGNWESCESEDLSDNDC